MKTRALLAIATVAAPAGVWAPPAAPPPPRDPASPRLHRLAHGPRPARARPRPLLRASARRGDGRLLDQSLQRLLRKGRRPLSDTGLHRAHHPAARHGEVRRSADRHRKEPSDALLPGQLGERGTWSFPAVPSLCEAEGEAGGEAGPEGHERELP